MLCLRSRSLSYVAARCIHRNTASWDWRRSPSSVPGWTAGNVVNLRSALFVFAHAHTDTTAFYGALSGQELQRTEGNKVQLIEIKSAFCRILHVFFFVFFLVSR